MKLEIAVKEQLSTTNLHQDTQMQANELRIGNWVEFEDYNYQIDAEDITDAGFYNPIPLTEEILLKCGAVKLKHNHFVIDEWIHLSFEDDNRNEPCVDIKVKSVVEKHSYYLTCVEFLHQLQNLYFALTGEELDIEL